MPSTAQVVMFKNLGMESVLIAVALLILLFASSVIGYGVGIVFADSYKFHNGPKMVRV